MYRKGDPWIKFYPHHLQDGGVNPRHLLCSEKGEGARDQALVVDGADLIDQKVGIPIQAIPGAETQAQGRGVFDQAGRQGNDQGRGMAGVQQELQA